jgi:spectinomycin phosphotransferase
VLAEPTDLDRAELANALERHWRLRASELEYLPVGFGSHHWRAVDGAGVKHFVTVDDLEAGFQASSDTDIAFAALERAFNTAAFLRDQAALEFVVAPMPDEEGRVIRRMSRRYSVTVSPLVAGESSQWGPWESAADRRAMGVVLARLHATTAEIPAGLPRREDFAIPSRAVVMEALAELGDEWRFGPYAEPTRHLLAENGGELERRLHEYDELVAEVKASSEPWVITHGEPHRANVIRVPDGSMLLVDWDTTLLAPRERDLRMVLDDDLTGWEEYSSTFGDSELDRRAIELYRRWWDLADTAIYVALFRQPHERDTNTVASWENLTHCLATLAKG